MRKYHFNEDYFEKIDTEDKAYWLGFIGADGTVVKASKYNSYRLRINLKSDDRDHLFLFSKCIGAETTPLIDYLNDSSKSGFGKSHQTRIVLNSFKLCTDLMNLNVIPDKTDTITMPVINENLIRHYIRGFVDGDGSFSCVKRKERESYRVGFEVVGNSVKILEQFAEYFSSFNIKASIYSRKNSNSKRLMISSSDGIKKLIHVLYDNSSIFLQRKYNKAQEIYR